MQACRCSPRRRSGPGSIERSCSAASTPSLIAPTKPIVISVGCQPKREPSQSAAVMVSASTTARPRTACASMAGPRGADITRRVLRLQARPPSLIPGQPTAARPARLQPLLSKYRPCKKPSRLQSSTSHAAELAADLRPPGVASRDSRVHVKPADALAWTAGGRLGRQFQRTVHLERRGKHAPRGSSARGNPRPKQSGQSVGPQLPAAPSCMQPTAREQPAPLGTGACSTVRTPGRRAQEARG